MLGVRSELTSPPGLLRFSVMPTGIDWSFVATIVGTIATVVFGVWGVLLYKRRQYPGKLAYFHDKPIRLFADITANLPEITVFYKGEPAKKNLTILRGFVVNTGSKDITREMVEKPLQIELDEGYRWLEASATSSQGGSGHVTIIDPKTVEFSLGLSRCDEALKFEGLIEVGEGKRWEGRVCLYHRISDTAAVKWHAVPTKVSMDPQTFVSFFMLGLIGVAFFLSSLKKTPPSIWGAAGGLLLTACMFLLFYAVLALKARVKRMRRILKLDPDDRSS
jgi:hypothetical protein